jgi:transmembrane sensor
MRLNDSWNPDLHEPTPAMLRQAARWQLQLRDAPDDSVRTAYAAWLEETPAHQFAAAEAEALTKATHALSTPLAPIAATRSRAGGWKTTFRAGMAAAAVYLLAFNLYPWLRDLNAFAVSGVGHQGRYALPDGSTVALNTDSRLDLAFTKTERRVSLPRGEAYFAVKKGDPRPFIVESGEGRVRVTGTHFYVRRDAEKVTVTVEEGHVLFSRGGTAPIVSLHAGDQAFLADHRVQEQPHADLLQTSAWRRKQIMFVDVPLSSVATELNRYRKGKIWVLPTSLRQRNVSGVFDAADTDAAAHTIVERLGARLVTLPNGTAFIF